MEDKHLAWGRYRSSHQILVRKHERKRPLGRPRHGWEDNIKLNLKERGTRMWTGFDSYKFIVCTETVI
jgi:hypothetical protein